MKKYECNYCEKIQEYTCQIYSTDYEYQGMLDVGSNLYAAEFFLYAFYSEKAHHTTESKQTIASPLMMLVAEG